MVLDDELDKLEHTISAMKAVLLDEEEPQSKSNAVHNWISKGQIGWWLDWLMKPWGGKLWPKVKRWPKEVRGIFSIPHQIAFRFKMSPRIKDIIRERPKDINAYKNQFHFSECMLNTHMMNGGWVERLLLLYVVMKRWEGMTSRNQL